MTSHPTEPIQPVHQPRPEARVILVGRTGLDQILRRDPRVELVRAVGALDAVGELSDPIDEGSPARAVVVVAPDADPSPAERPAFLQALRVVDPGVRVLAVGSAAPAGYDGAIERGRLDPIWSDASDLPARPAITPAPRDEPADTAPDHNTPEIVIPSRSRSAQTETQADTRPAGGTAPILGAETIEALARGEGVGEIAARELGRALGRPGLRWVTPDDGADPLEGDLYDGDAPARLGESASRWLEAVRTLAARMEGLRTAALTDPLTGAWNRRYFDRFLTRAIERARTNRTAVTLLLFDIDDFKRYNDSYGHPAGDEILAESVRLLRTVTRPTDRVCRIGGDEFGVIFDEPEGPRTPGSSPPESISAIASRFQRQVCEHRFPKLGAEAEGSLTISGGLATFPWDGLTPEALLAHADKLAMRSKAHGKNIITLGPGAELACRLDPDGEDPPS